VQSRVSKWGNSLGIRIPSALASQAGLSDGTRVEVSVEEGQVVIRKARYSLESLLAQITDENRHEETSTGDPVGREAW
jgi:antitoxin MazE